MLVRAPSAVDLTTYPSSLPPPWGGYEPDQLQERWRDGEGGADLGASWWTLLLHICCPMCLRGGSDQVRDQPRKDRRRSRGTQLSMSGLLQPSEYLEII